VQNQRMEEWANHVQATLGSLTTEEGRANQPSYDVPSLHLKAARYLCDYLIGQ